MTEDKKDGMDSIWNQTDSGEPHGNGEEWSSGASAENALPGPDNEAGLEDSPGLLDMKLEPEPKPEPKLEPKPEPDHVPETSGRDKQEPARDGFKPYYKKEARVTGLLSLGLYFLLAVFGLALLGFGVQVFLDGAPFRLEVATTVIIVFALLGVLWKTISLEAKTGVAAAGVGLVLAEVFTVYGGSLGLPWVPGELVLAVVYCLSLAALLVAAWLYWPRLFWPPIVVTVLVLYAALDPVLWLVAGATGPLETMVSGPAFMQHWPIYLRSGFLMVQVILPLGAVLFLVLQGRTILKPQYDSHWGYVFWALLLILTSTTGLALLERADYRAYPDFPALVAQAYPRALPPTPVATATEDKTATTTPQAAAPDASEAQTSTGAALPADQAVTEPQPSQESGLAATTPPEKTAETTEPATGLTEEKLPATPETAPSGEASVAAEPTPAEVPSSEDLTALKAEVNQLKNQVKGLQDRLQDQEKLIRSLLDYFGSDSYQGRPPWPSLPDTMPLPEPDDSPDQPGELITPKDTSGNYT